MFTGNKPIFSCEFSILFNVNDKVSLDLFKSDYYLYLSGLLLSQSFFSLKFTSYIQHILFNKSPPEVNPCFLVYL